MPSAAEPILPPPDASSGRATGASSGASTPARAAWGVNLRQRVLTAAVLIPLVLAVAWLGGWVAFVAAALVLAVGTWEMRALCAHRGWHPPLLLSAALGVSFLLAAELPGARLLVLEIGISALVVGSFVWLTLARPPVERTLVEWALTLAITFYLGWGLMFALLLRGTQGGLATRGCWWLLLLLLGVWANDSAAFLVGHAVGRHPLAPRVSPHKTWEGAVGGLVATVAAVLIVVFVANTVLPPALRLPLPWYEAPLLGALIVVAGVLGDLAKSLVKRAVGVKDSGAILPGHGGMLDRIDSMLFAGYVVYFYALFLGALR
jgi:phosphatidate cytidylyltransferase